MRSIVASADPATVQTYLLLYRLDGLYIMTTFTQDIAIADARAPRVGWRGWAALVVLMLPVLLVSVDNTVLSFALPQIALDLEPTATQQLWIIDAYPLVLASLLVTMGVLGDRFGRRRMLLIGATGFGLVSAAGGVRTERRVAHRRSRGHGRVRRDADALHAVAPAEHLRQPRPAPPRDRRVGGGLLGRCRARTRRGRHPAGALRVGRGVPHGRPGARSAADPRADPGAREPRPEPRSLRSHECRPVAADHGADRLRDQGVRGARHREPAAAGPLRRGHRVRRAVRAPPEPPRDPHARHGALPPPHVLGLGAGEPAQRDRARRLPVLRRSAPPADRRPVADGGRARPRARTARDDRRRHRRRADREAGRPAHRRACGA